MSYLSRIANSMPCTHWLGWPWFSHSFTSRPTSAAGRFLAIDDALQERVGADVGDRQLFLPAAHVLASNASPGRREYRLRGVDGEFRLRLGQTVGRRRPRCAGSVAATPRLRRSKASKIRRSLDHFPLPGPRRRRAWRRTKLAMHTHAMIAHSHLRVNCATAAFRFPMEAWRFDRTPI